MYFYIYKKKKKTEKDKFYKKIQNLLLKKYNLKEINYIKNNIFLSDKIISYKWDKLFTKIGVFQLFKNKNFMGECFIIYPNQKIILKNLEIKNKLFFLKPSTLYSSDIKNFTSGKGIIVTRNLNNTIQNNKYDQSLYYLCQKDIGNPYLIDGYKSDFRVYMLITKNKDNIVYYINKNIDIKLCFQKYNKNSNRGLLSNGGLGGWAKYFIRKLQDKNIKINNSIIKQIRILIQNGINPKAKKKYKEIMKYWDYDFYRRSNKDINKQVLDKVLSDIKAQFDFNIFEDIEKNNVSVLNEYHLLGLDVMYNTSNKQTYLLEINSKIDQGYATRNSTITFNKMLKDKKKIVENLIKNSHKSESSFEKFRHFKI